MNQFKFQPKMENKAFPTAEKFSMTEKVSYAEGSVVSKIIIRNEKGNVTLFAFDKGEFLSEHTAPFDAIVQVLDGRGEVVIDGQAIELNTGIQFFFSPLFQICIYRNNSEKKQRGYF